MRICKVHENEIKIKGSRGFLVLSAIAAAMALPPVKTSVETWLQQGYFTDGDIFDLVLDIPWVLIFLLVAFRGYQYSTGYLVINNNGVKLHSLIKDKFYSWAEIEDFGVSYFGKINHSDDVYYFYFSKEMLPIGNNDEKKVRGQVIKTMIFEGDLQDFTDEVIPFCRRFTGVVPFISGNSDQ